MSCHQAIKDAREKAGLNKTQVAGEADILLSNYIKYEGGQLDISSYIAGRICNALRVLEADHDDILTAQEACGYQNLGDPRVDKGAITWAQDQAKTIIEDDYPGSVAYLLDVASSILYVNSLGRKFFRGGDNPEQQPDFTGISMTRALFDKSRAVGQRGKRLTDFIKGESERFLEVNTQWYFNLSREYHKEAWFEELLAKWKDIYPDFAEYWGMAEKRKKSPITPMPAVILTLLYEGTELHFRVIDHVLRDKRFFLVLYLPAGDFTDEQRVAFTEG